MSSRLGCAVNSASSSSIRYTVTCRQYDLHITWPRRVKKITPGVCHGSQNRLQKHGVTGSNERKLIGRFGPAMARLSESKRPLNRRATKLAALEAKRYGHAAAAVVARGPVVIRRRGVIRPRHNRTAVSITTIPAAIKARAAVAISAAVIRRMVS